MENNGIEPLNLLLFKTKAKASAERHATFIFTIESTTSTHISNNPIDKSEASDIDFTATSLSFDINKNDETRIVSTESILSSTPNSIKKFPILKSPPKILPLSSKLKLKIN